MPTPTVRRGEPNNIRHAAVPIDGRAPNPRVSPSIDPGSSNARSRPGTRGFGLGPNAKRKRKSRASMVSGTETTTNERVAALLLRWSVGY